MNRRATQRIAIVGGAGLIGRWLARALASFDHDVTVIDIETPPPDLLESCKYRQCDVRESAGPQQTFNQFDTVYLLASKLSKLCNADPRDGWCTNVIGTANVLAEVARHEVSPRLVYFSSSMVYSSKTTICPLSETAPVAGESLYDRTKIAGEELIKSFCFAHGSSAVILRPFSVYGPDGMCAQRGHFIGVWLKRAKAGLPLVIDGDGTQTIDLVHVQDVVQACLHAHKLQLTQGEVQTFNVGSGQDVPVRSIARWIQQVASTVRTESGPARPHTIQRRLADLRKAQRMLGYRPTISPEQGVKSLVATELGGKTIT